MLLWYHHLKYDVEQPPLMLFLNQCPHDGAVLKECGLQKAKWRQALRRERLQEAFKQDTSRQFSGDGAFWETVGLLLLHKGGYLVILNAVMFVKMLLLKTTAELVSWGVRTQRDKHPEASSS